MSTKSNINIWSPDYFDQTLSIRERDVSVAFAPDGDEGDIIIRIGTEFPDTFSSMFRLRITSEMAEHLQAGLNACLASELKEARSDATHRQGVS